MIPLVNRVESALAWNQAYDNEKPYLVIRKSKRRQLGRLIFDFLPSHGYQLSEKGQLDLNKLFIEMEANSKRYDDRVSYAGEQAGHSSKREIEVLVKYGSDIEKLIFDKDNWEKKNRIKKNLGTERLLKIKKELNKFRKSN